MDWGQFDQEGAMRQRYLELDERTDEIKKTVQHLPGGFAAFQDLYDISWIFHENGLEGVVLTYPEIKSAVDNKIISDVSLLPTYQDIKNQKYCLDTMREKAATRRYNVTINSLKEMHGRLVDNPEEAGVYRKDIPIHRTYFHEIAQPSKIHAGLLKVLEYVRARPPKEMHPLEHAAAAHHRFMRVFPFSNYSGILGRLIGNFLLIRAGYFPVIIHSSDRQRYYEALRGSERDFRLFVVEAMENSLENADKFYFGDERLDLPQRAAASQAARA
jgi:Fic family protein